MLQKDFADKVVELVKKDENVIGLAAAGSWITHELDEYSDLDLVLITQNKIGGDKEKMIGYARSFGDFISGFTGEHVGEPRVLICLYDNPLLHVDIKFLTPGEFEQRAEDPIILFEREEQLTNLIGKTKAVWPQPDPQWIEDRFWTWVQYIAAKAARGEYFECIDGLGMIRSLVLAPLLQLKNKNPPRGLRKVEMQLPSADLEDLKTTIPEHSKEAVISALENSIRIYRSLRPLFSTHTLLQSFAEKRSMEYLEQVKQGFD
ncbi:MAG TPA: nucleotidyltransferase domain-containing protein [Chitinophagaceae bacterium]|nr:nucleotidyltransferase domain-containing protein [Chitinophagaceae bacterium]